MKLFNKPTTENLIAEYDNLQIEIRKIDGKIEFYNIGTIGLLGWITCFSLCLFFNFRTSDTIFLGGMGGMLALLIGSLVVSITEWKLFKRFFPANRKQKGLMERCQIIKSELIDMFSDIEYQHQFFTKMHLTINELNKYNKSAERDHLIGTVRNLKNCLCNQNYNEFVEIFIANAKDIEQYTSLIKEVKEQEENIIDIDKQLNSYSKSRGLPSLPNIEQNIEKEVEDFKYIL